MNDKQAQELINVMQDIAERLYRQNTILDSRLEEVVENLFGIDESLQQIYENIK